MMKNLIVRTLYERRWFTAGWALIFAVMTTLVVMFYPSFSEVGSIDQLAKTMPQQLRGLIGDPADYRSLEGFIATQIYDIRMPLLIMIMSLMLAISLTIKEEESGELRSLSSLSIGRTKLLMHKWIAGICILLVLNLVAVAGTYVGVISLSEDIPHELIWRLMVLSTAFGAVAFTLPFIVGMASGIRSATLFIGLTVTVGSFLLTTFAKAVDWLEPWEQLSLIHYYSTSALLNGYFNATNNWILAIIGAVALIVGIVMFRQRDIA